MRGDICITVPNHVCLDKYTLASHVCTKFKMVFQLGQQKGVRHISVPHGTATHEFLVILVRAEWVRQRNEVNIKLGIIFSLSPLSSSHHLLNLKERVVVGFPNLAWGSN
jgi:hypothetical protein